MAQTTAPFGSWRSPITSDLIVASVVGLSEIQLDGTNTYWIESRPTEAGRNVIVRLSPDGQVTDLNPPPFNARTTVHEYGGGAYLAAGGSVFFSNYADQRLYRIDSGSAPRPITPALKLRFADAFLDRPRARLLCVQEDHRASDASPVNTLVEIDIDGTREIRTLVSGADFYSSPRLSPDGTQLAWLSWNHPNMPWIGTELWVADVSPDGSPGAARLVAGGLNESIFQPEWSPGGMLHFVSDRTGWWNLYAVRPQGVKPLAPMEAEFGQPAWTLGLSCYAFISENQIACTYTRQGAWELALLDSQTGKLSPLGIAGTDFDYLRANASRVVVRCGAPDAPFAVAELDLQTGKSRILRQSAPTPDDALRPYISVPKSVEFPSEDGQTAYAFLYAPKNPAFAAPAGELPPLIVKSHGGPTGATNNTLSFGTHYWTSRGFAVLDVNYGGSTGYGRAYRGRLTGKWGIVDVADCTAGAAWAAAQGFADAKRLLITGGSAGGYTTLCALTFRKVFAGGASYYGISDLEALARDTHKFESRYLDGLVGPYPRAMQVYHDRSPVHFASQLSVPVIFMQGEEDKVVPPNQAEVMVNALRAQGLPVGYFLFAGEQHGFRRSENIKRALDGELSFYAFLPVRSELRF
jgi:dipeptidyl aminopeptidase/acylaminoacyl peptidase